MARQPQGLDALIDKPLRRWLSGSLLGLLFIVCLPGLGWAIDRHGLVEAEPSVFFEDDVVPGTPDLPLIKPLPEMGRTEAWHEDLIQILRHQGPSHQVLRPPVPSPEAICGSLKTILSNFDVASEQLPEPLRQRLCRRIHTYAVRYRRDVQAMLHRADNHLPMIKRAFRQHGLPTYYAYVPMVESAFQPDAMHNGSGARGLWQLLRRTALTSGLTVSKSVDERIHPKRSTEAAVTYLKHLHRRFGAHGPLYVLAAYNFGETNLSRKMRHADTRDVAALYARGRLPGETREYLLRMMTMWVITAHPGRFHFLLREAADRSLPPLEPVRPGEVSVGVAEGGKAKK